jgi:hypothetical protein
VRVELSSTAEKQLAKTPGHIVKKFALWVDLVTVEGLAAARAIPGYRDHGLKGELERLSGNSFERRIQGHLPRAPGRYGSRGLR